jgi:glycosyl transferase family 87
MAATGWVLGRDPVRGSKWRLGAIVLFATLFRLALVPTEPTLSDDIYRYLWDGRVQLAGQNPYRYAPDDPDLQPLRDALYHKINHRSVPTIYPPASQLLFRLLAALGAGVTGFKLGMCAVDLLVVLALAALLREMEQPLAHLVFYAWNPLVVLETASSGHAECLAALLVVLALGMLRMRRRAVSGALLGAAILAKLYPAFFTPVWLPSLKRRGLAAMAAACVVLAALYWTGDRAPLVGLGTFAEHWNHNEFVYRLLLALSPNRDVAKLASAFLFVLAACILMVRSRPDDLDGAVRRSEWLLFWLLCLSPTVHPWYVSWLAPFIALCPRLGPLIWTATVPLSYEILLGYRAAGVWEEKAWVVAVEYIPVCVALVADAALRLRRGDHSSAKLRTPT